MIETLQKGWEWTGTPDGNSKMFAAALLAAGLAALFAVYGLPLLGLVMAPGMLQAMCGTIAGLVALNIMNHRMSYRDGLAPQA